MLEARWQPPHCRVSGQEIIPGQSWSGFGTSLPYPAPTSIIFFLILTHDSRAPLHHPAPNSIINSILTCEYQTSLHHLALKPSTYSVIKERLQYPAAIIPCQLLNGIATSLRDVALASFALHGFDARCTHLAPSWSLWFSKVVDVMFGPERVCYLAASGHSGTERVSYLAPVSRSTLHSSRVDASGRFSTSLQFPFCQDDHFLLLKSPNVSKYLQKL
ncbi:hypothetical protein F2Q69_00019396 [Brassica cretica]|uniref:Uncharacterized protein n=1 Tax=Brassica cretica TaxID=69181 RepID=A0A8S9QRP3_BRACR|nr:hypothetical protein F2Q69_00019396 [Brassica cretica]